MTLLHNPIADLTSRQFLIFYGTLCALVVLAGAWLVRWISAMSSDGWEPLPQNLDAYEIAYLRGDINELVRFIVFDLVRSGALELSPRDGKKPPVFRHSPAAPSAETLGSTAQAVYDFFVEPHSAEQLFASQVPQKVAQLYEPERALLERRRLFTMPIARSAMVRARLVGLLLILGFGGYRLWYAYELHHRNIGFTILIGVASIVLLFLLTALPRLSRRGRQYLRSLRAALPAPANSGVVSNAFPLIVAAGGMAVLAGTPYAGLGDTFRQAAAATSSSTSGGCGSGYGSGGGSGDGGGGDGGGCGGGCGG